VSYFILSICLAVCLCACRLSSWPRIKMSNNSHVGPQISGLNMQSFCYLTIRCAIYTLFIVCRRKCRPKLAATVTFQRQNRKRDFAVSCRGVIEARYLSLPIPEAFHICAHRSMWRSLYCVCTSLIRDYQSYIIDRLR